VRESRIVGIRGKLTVCAATVALTASSSLTTFGSMAAAAARADGPAPGAARLLGSPSFTGIYLSTWGTAHVTFGDGFRTWLAQNGAGVSAQAPVKLDADGGGFTLPASAAAADRLDEQGRIAYQGAIVISEPARKLSVRFGPLYIRVMPDLAWSAGLSVDGMPAKGAATDGVPAKAVPANGAAADGATADGAATDGATVNGVAADGTPPKGVPANGAARPNETLPREIGLADGDESEVLAGGGTPSPTGFRAASMPFHLTRDAADLLARESGRPGPVAGSLFGTLVPQFDHVPTAG
jgi:hypothetical protein